MWIIPNNHPLYSALAQEFVDSKEDLKEYAQDLIGNSTQPQLLWRSKHSSTGTWLGRWNRVYWLPHLFGRTLKPSIGKSFEEKLTSFLEDIPANRCPWPESKKELKTPGTCGPTSPKESEQLDLWGASLKTLETTLTSTGNRLVLNPAWVLCLMGTTLEKTFCEWREMELLRTRQK